MALPNLHKFLDDLKSRPADGSNKPPRTIKARDLDENFTKVTLLESDQFPKSYTVDYTKDGIRIKLETKEFDVCENGNPVKYVMAAWKTT